MSIFGGLYHQPRLGHQCGLGLLELGRELTELTDLAAAACVVTSGHEPREEEGVLGDVAVYDSGVCGRPR